MAGSTISTDPAVLAAASRCFDTCIPLGSQKPVQTYLWAQIAGITDPAVVLTNARCFMSCVPPGGQLALQAYLAAVLAGGSLDPSTLANAARCFSSCIPPGANGAVITYALANKAGGSTDPSTLVNAARCFSSCIPMGFQLAAQNYLMAVAAGVSTNPQVLLSSAAYSCFNCNLLPGMAGSVTASSIAAYAAGGGPTPPVCPVPTGLTAVQQVDFTVIITWGAVPAGIDYTEIWTSPDNITFTLTDAIAAPGATTTLPAVVALPYVEIRFCTGTIPSFPLTAAFMAQVVTNGAAAPATSTRVALQTFETAIASVLSKIHHLNVVVPDSLIAAKTPFIHNYGNSLWTTVQVGTPPAESITVNGIKAATDASNGKVYDLGFNPADVATFTTGNCGCFAYWSDAVPVSSAADGIGCYNGATAIGVQAYNGGNFLGIGWNTGAILFVAHSQIGGFYMMSRTATNVLKGYLGNATNAFALLGTQAGATGAVNTSPHVGACGEIQAGPTAVPNHARFSCFGVCDGLTLAEGTIIFNAVQALRISLGGGFV